MTENQIKYLTLQENARHNAATEELQGASNAEIVRANRAREDDTDLSRLLTSAGLQETIRSNKVKESQEWWRQNVNNLKTAFDWISNGIPQGVSNWVDLIVSPTSNSIEDNWSQQDVDDLMSFFGILG